MHHRRNNNRRFRHRSNNRNQGHRNNNNGMDGVRLGSATFSNGRFRNGMITLQGAEKLVEKYNLLAKEALTSGDRTLSENYYQHADHFMRIVYEKNLAQKQNNSQINEQKVIADEKNLTNKSKEEEKK